MPRPPRKNPENAINEVDVVSCLLAVGGDTNNIVPKVVSYPEAICLMAGHGTESVQEIEIVGKRRIGQDDEKNRLVQMYGPWFHASFPGAHPRITMRAPQGTPVAEYMTKHQRRLARQEAGKPEAEEDPAFTDAVAPAMGNAKADA